MFTGLQRYLPRRHKGALPADYERIAPLPRDLCECESGDESKEADIDEAFDTAAPPRRPLRVAEAAAARHWPPQLADELLKRYSLLVLGTDGRIRNWNEGLRRLFGYDEDEVAGKHISLLCTSDEKIRGIAEGELGIAALSGYYCGNCARRRKDGSTFEATVQIHALRDSRNRVCCFFEVIEEVGKLSVQESTAVDELRRTAERLHQENESMRTMLTVIGDGVITTDRLGMVTSINPTAEQMTGWSSEEALGKPASMIFRIVSESTRLPISNPVARALYDERIVELESCNMLLSRDGSCRAIEDSCAPVLNQELEVTGAVLVFRDVTNLRRHARELQHQAQHDALTGLVNRSEFERRLRRILESPSPRGSHVLFYLDLDRFKAVNDSCGHLAGDELLRQVAALIDSKVRHRDTLARLGGDEFGILLEHCELQQAMRVAEVIHDALGRHPFVWDSKSFQIGVSIGVVHIGADEWNVAELVEAADAACYAAKQEEGCHICVHASIERRHGGAAVQNNWEQRLRHALKHDLFELHFQPIVAMADREPVSLRGEILLRLADKGGGLVVPKAFIAAAERGRLMPEIDQWVLRQLLVLLKPNAGSLIPGRDMITVNVSAQSIASKTFLGFVQSEVGRIALPPECLCFEIAEEAASSNLRASTSFMEALHGQHFPLALDNFGAGPASFERLRSLPVDYLKIDGNVIGDVASDPVDTAIVEAISKVGHLLGIRTIAVGADSQQILNHLKSVGLEYVQGFTVAPPEPLQLRLAELQAA